MISVAAAAAALLILPPTAAGISPQSRRTHATPTWRTGIQLKVKAPVRAVARAFEKSAAERHAGRVNRTATKGLLKARVAELKKQLPPRSALRAVGVASLLALATSPQVGVFAARQALLSAARPIGLVAGGLESAAPVAVAAPAAAAPLAKAVSAASSPAAAAAIGRAARSLEVGSVLSARRIAMLPVLTAFLRSTAASGAAAVPAAAATGAAAGGASTATTASVIGSKALGLLLPLSIANLFV